QYPQRLLRRICAAAQAIYANGPQAADELALTVAVRGAAVEFVDGCVTVATRRSSSLDRGLPISRFRVWREAANRCPTAPTRVYAFKLSAMRLARTTGVRGGGTRAADCDP